jgi:uncharacterized protein (TIGR03790 family)
LSVRVAVLAAALLTVGPVAAAAQSAENVAVIINERSEDSRRIGEHYIRVRAIPPSNVIRIQTVTDEAVERAVFVNTILRPIGATLLRERLQDRILYIVLTKGIPLRIAGTGGTEGTMASVDSELTLVYRQMTGQSPPIVGRTANPYYLGSRAVADAKPFTHREHDIYLVTRLDAFTVDEAIALIDRALAPRTDGRIVLDTQAKLVNRTGDDWLEAAAARLTSQGEAERVVLDTTPEGVRSVTPVLGYYSWGSNDPGNQVRRFDMAFVPGSLAGTFVSTDARTFREPPAGWKPSSAWTEQAALFAGSPQTLTGDLIREGATGVAGHVAEPYLQSAVRPEILFPAYLAGFNLVESFYLAMPHLSWQNIVIGDPLCAPFRRASLASTEIGDALDQETMFPAQFAARRVAQLARALPGLEERAVKLAARTESLIARSDNAGARTTLEELTRLVPQHAPFHLQLGLLYEGEQNHTAAMAQYRRVLEIQPDNVVALNNLAYAVATHGKAPTEALPLAMKALASAPRNPVFLDTVAWIEHLLGNDASAATRIAVAVRGAPTSADIRLHAAIIYAAVGNMGAAQTELGTALALQPALANDEAVKELRGRLPNPQ